MTKSSFSTITLTRRKTGPFLVRAAFTSSATSPASRTVPTSAMPQPLAISARSAPAPELGRAVVARTGVRGLIAGLAELLVVEHDDRQILRLLRRHRGERAETHHQVGVARDHQHPLVGLRQGEAQPHADRCAHGAPQRHVERPIARLGDVPVRRAEARDHQKIVVGAFEDLLDQRTALQSGLAHLAVFFPKSLMPISFWRSRTATDWPPLKAARAAASTVAFTSLALSTE